MQEIVAKGLSVTEAIAKVAAERHTSKRNLEDIYYSYGRQTPAPGATERRGTVK